jgi:hypothetical protein
MAVREFLDESGTPWRVWSLTAAASYPQTPSTDDVAEVDPTGWLVFESVSTGEKRRLSLYRQRWAEAPDVELRAMLARAETVRESDADAELAQRGAPADQQPIRTFRYPEGRYWTACVVVRQEDGGPPVLRFTAGARIIELGNWPKQWTDFSDEQLIDLLRWAAPRADSGSPPPGTPRRRWDDQLGQAR